MGGKYTPLIRGEMYGLKIGIDTELNLWEHSRQLKYDELEGEYLIGIGVGFTKAQQIRTKLQQGNERLTFKKKTQLFKYLIEKHFSRYAMFTDISADFLDNIENWTIEKIPVEVYEEVQLLLQKRKIQRAIDRIYHLNYNGFRLKAIVEFEPIKSSLSAIREQKKRGKISDLESTNSKIQVGHNLTKWIEARLEANDTIINEQ